MWHKPQLMSEITKLLMAGASAAMLIAGAWWSARLPLFPLREIVVLNELQEVRRSELEAALAGQLRGNFFSIELDDVRAALEKMDWVRYAEVRRQWPGKLEVEIEEYLPAAFWGAEENALSDMGSVSGIRKMVSIDGEIFSAAMHAAPPESMPVLQGPEGLAPEMLGYYQQAEETLRPIKRFPRVLSVSPRLAVQLQLDDGMIVELGRQQQKTPVRERLERFVAYYPSVLTAAKKQPTVVDMRYPNGFSLRTSALLAAENKGKS